MPPPILHQALAMTAGTLFEATPFVLAVNLVRAPWMRWAAALFGCGCGSAAGPAALSLPAAALCWMVFGPWTALARFGAAVVLQCFMRRTAQAPTVRADPLAQLEDICLPGFALAIGSALLQTIHVDVRSGSSTPMLAIAEGIAGAAAGALAPCSTAAVALAAMLRGVSPSAAAGLLATAGIVPRLHLRDDSGGADRDDRWSLGALTIACAILAARGGHGFVHPRLVPLLWCAAVAAGIAMRTSPRTASSARVLAPGVMLAALVFGSPVPAAPVGASTFDTMYPGQRLEFTGLATLVRGRTALVRYAITCCRADASAIVLPTDLRERFPDHTWLHVGGTIVRDALGDTAHVVDWHRVRPPDDPFVYR